MKMRSAIFFALLAAALYALNAPLAKLLLADVAPSMMAALLYLGAGAGMLLLGLARRRTGRSSQEETIGSLFQRDLLPFTLGMILLDIAAPILLMMGIRLTSPESASLLNNFEIVATSLIALLLFRERISPRLWTAIGLIVVASTLLSLQSGAELRLSAGSLLVILASSCWGLENNCTRRLSSADPLKVVIVKGLGSGTGALLVALLTGEAFPAWQHVPAALLLGFVAYGLSIFFYVHAQRHLGAAKTSAYYAVAPFIGVALSLLIFREMPGKSFFLALAVMIAATFLVTADGFAADNT
ncbi:MAG: DMT family transporter [Clostridia bacterium]|nr:DMT family transporter [Clostridia bacterium]